uniref:uncharacterized protein LOC122588192 n=1 Tax=Erigeron canadensis TaxID=72917 RepID=UPI001CB8D39A|nr:uncharacterized protein LOC122588192 [Erigeron canadensis]
MRPRRVFGISVSLIIINLASIMEHADENLLPSVYKEVSETFKAGPTNLGYLTFIRNFVQGLASPLAGILVLTYPRPIILTMGTLCWALSTFAVGGSRYYIQVAFLRAINGFGLAIVIPALQSFIADTYSDNVRGTGFGFLNLVGLIGGMGGGVVATVMAGHEFWGVAGWRCAFFLMAGLSCLIGVLVFFFVVDPKRLTTVDGDTKEIYSERNALLEQEHESGYGSIWVESWKAMKLVIKVKTFQIIVLQGVVGSFPWTAMVFFTMWFELIGFDNQKAAALVSLFGIGTAFGSLLGGIIADQLSKMYPYSGRVMCAQFSAIMGIPLTWFLLLAIPQSVDNYFIYAVTLLFMGLTISWNGPACNAPMFAEVVPTKHRTMIYAFDRAFEVSFSSFAAPIVGILAEKIYGYDLETVDPISESSSNALALSKGLFVMMVLPFGICCLLYTPLYWVFKLDNQNVRMSSIKGEVI